MTGADKADLLWEKDQLTALILDFGWALDAGDWTLYRACLHDPVRIDFERLTGFPEVEVGADDWTAFARLALAPAKRHHSYTNLRITIDGQVAAARVHMTARHFLSTDNGSAENTQYGWYEFGFARADDGRWQITRVKHWFQWVSGNAGLFDFSSGPVAEAMDSVFKPANLVSGSDPAAAP